MMLVSTPTGLTTSTALSIKVKDVSIFFFAESKKHAVAELLNHDKQVTGELREACHLLPEYISSDTKMNLAQNPGMELDEVVGAYREIRRSVYEDNESPYRILRGVSANGDFVGADEHHQFCRYEYLLLEWHQRDQHRPQM